MTLEEAKERLKELVNYCDRSDCWDAFKTILNYTENESIPKEKVRKKIEQLTENDNLVINEKWDSFDVVCAKREEIAQVDILQELLG